MNLYLVVKTLHILSSVLLVGTGFGTAFYLFFANRTPAPVSRPGNTQAADSTRQQDAAIGSMAAASAAVWVEPLRGEPKRGDRGVARGPRAHQDRGPRAPCAHPVSTRLQPTYFRDRTLADTRASMEAQAVVSRLVVRADLWFTTPAVIFQPLSGFALMKLAGWPLATPWIVASVALYVFAGACWLPVLVLQHRMARTVAADLAARRPLSASYWQDARRWERLGYPAFVAMIAIYALMANKPALWG